MPKRPPARTKAVAPPPPAKPAKPAHYILVARDTHFRLIGPFARAYDAARWAKAKKNNPGDDPRWQTIQLADAKAAVPIYAPADPMPA